jgi:hypothetical protein
MQGVSMLSLYACARKEAECGIAAMSSTLAASLMVV